MPLLTSCLITPPGGAEYEMIGYLLVKPTRFRFTALGDISTATLEFIGVSGTLGPIIVAGSSITINSGESGASGLWGEAIGGEAVFGEGGSTDGGVFVGKIATVDTKAVVVKASATGHTRFICQCQALETDFLEKIITTDATYSVESDADIIADVFSNLPEASVLTLTNVTAVSTLSLTVRAGWTVRQFLDEVISRVQAIYYVSGSALYYHAENAAAAPFNLKELQDVGSGEIAPLWNNFSHTTSWTNRANRVVVLGVASTGGTRVTATVDDATSQGTYGIISRNVVDANIQGSGEATARGNVELANFANPQVSGRFETRTEGFYVGQSITITMPSEIISSACFIRSVEWSWETPEVTTFACEFGQFSANLIRRLTRIQQEAKEKPYVPIAIPAPAVIAPSHFSATIEPVHLVASLPTLPNATYPDNSVVVLTTTGKLYRNVAGTWSAAVASTDLTGTITTTQIADDSISTPKLQANSITSAKIGAGEVTAGKLAADSVIAGTIAAGAIRAVDAAFDTAAIQTADIANAAITDAKIDSLSASKITTGTLDAGTITVTNLNATNITTGTLNGSRIGSGTITGGSGGHIASATITDANISSLSATKITTGTLDASLITVSNLSASSINTGTLNASVVTVTNLSASVLTAGTITAAISISSGGSLFVSGTAQINSVDFVGGQTSGSHFIASTRVASNGDYYLNGSQVINSSGAFVGAGVDVGSNGVGCGGVNIGGTNVVVGRQTGPGTPSFASVADAQTWCGNLLSALQTHGLVT